MSLIALTICLQVLDWKRQCGRGRQAIAPLSKLGDMGRTWRNVWQRMGAPREGETMKPEAVGIECTFPISPPGKAYLGSMFVKKLAASVQREAPLSGGGLHQHTADTWAARAESAGEHTGMNVG